MQKKSIHLFQKVLPITTALVLIGCIHVNTTLTNNNVSKLFSDLPWSFNVYTLQEQAKKDPTIVRSRYVNVEFRQLAGEHHPEGAESIILNLFHDVTLKAEKIRLEIRSSERYTWFGRIAGIEHSQVILTVENGSMAGNITFPGGIYQIRDADNGIHAIYEIDQSFFPQDDPPSKNHFPTNPRNHLS